MDSIDTVCVGTDDMKSCSAASRSRKKIAPLEIMITLVKNSTPDPPCKSRFPIRHLRDDLDARTEPLIDILHYVPHISFMPLNLLNVYPMKGNARSADC